MTKKELIEALANFPDDAEVFVRNFEGEPELLKYVEPTRRHTKLKVILNTD